MTATSFPKKLIRKEHLSKDANTVNRLSTMILQPSQKFVKNDALPQLTEQFCDQEEATTMSGMDPKKVTDLRTSLAKMQVSSKIDYLDPMFKTPSKEKNEGRQLAEEKQVAVPRKSHDYFEKYQTATRFSPDESDIVSNNFDQSLEISEFAQSMRANKQPQDDRYSSVFKLI